MISRDQVPALVLPEEEIQVAALGGSVLVRGLVFSRAMLFAIEASNSLTDHVPLLLSRTVLADDGEPVFTPEQWEIFGGQHRAQTIELYKVASRLSGLDSEDAEKK